MKVQIFALVLFLLPSIVFADSSFFNWLNNLKVIPNVRSVEIRKAPQKPAKPVEEKVLYGELTPLATSTTATSTSATSTISAIKQIISSVKDDVYKSDQGLLKAENESLKRTISSLQTKISSLNSQIANFESSCLTKIEDIKEKTSPKALARVKEIEWLIMGVLDNNYRNKIDAEGNRTPEKVVNSAFFRSLAAKDFIAMLKEYDELTGSSYYLMFKNFTLTPPSSENKVFDDLYYLFLNNRKFPR